MIINNPTNYETEKLPMRGPNRDVGPSSQLGDPQDYPTFQYNKEETLQTVNSNSNLMIPSLQVSQQSPLRARLQDTQLDDIEEII
jgi:hypothetical protein